MTISKDKENWIAEQSLQEILQTYQSSILPSHNPIVRYVEGIARRIIDAIDPKLSHPTTRWKVFVIESKEANAFVLPSGDIFVFTGILPIAANPDGLAAILGHEIAHKLVRHGAEKMSFYHFFTLAFSAIQIFITGDINSTLGGFFQNLLVFLPFSRKCEVEADYIGLLLMAKACYDPHEAKAVWQRMMNASKGKSVPAFISTHPSHSQRIEKIDGWLYEAEQIYDKAGCNQKQSFFKVLGL